MNEVMIGLAVVVATAAAVYSTWSPCGQSMLSTITPLGERRRGARFGWTAGWFVVGSVAGGLSLGGLAAVLAAGVHAVGPGSEQVAIGAALLAALTLASDLRVGGFRLPWHHRQVNERWLDRYRPWLYGVGFGWQIGCGFATYIMTAALYLMVGLAALGASPPSAFVVCGLFGLTRGLAVLLVARVQTPESLRAFHRRFDAYAAPARRLVLGSEALTLLVALGLVARSFTVAVVAALILLGVGAAATVAARGRRAMSR